MVSIGSIGHDSSNGHVRLFQYTDSAWSQVGSDIDSSDTFGHSVALNASGDIVAGSATEYNGNAGLVNIYDVGHTDIYNTVLNTTTQTSTNLDIFDSSTNSCVCISGNGKYIRTVNSGDLSSNATSYYSEDYGNSFHIDHDLTQKLSLFDISINTLDDYHSYTRPKFGSDKLFMSYDGQHQLVPKGVSNNLTFDDYLYVSNNYGKNWNLRKNIQDTSGHFVVRSSDISSNWYWNSGAVSADGKHMYVSGKTGVWKSDNYGLLWNQTSADSSFNHITISADGKYVYGVSDRVLYGSTNYGSSFSTLYTDSSTSDPSYCAVSSSGSGKYLTLADGSGSYIYMSSDYGSNMTLHNVVDSSNSLNCGISHSGKIVLNSHYLSLDYGENFHYIPDLISSKLSGRDSFYSKANAEYIFDPSDNFILQIPFKSSNFQDLYSKGTVKVGSTTYSSDYRIKNNVEELNDEDTVNELHPVSYYNTNEKRKDYGFLAHELQEKYPFLVEGDKDGDSYQSINYNGLISLLLHEVKTLKTEYNDLKSTIEKKNT